MKTILLSMVLIITAISANQTDNIKKLFDKSKIEEGIKKYIRETNWNKNSPMEIMLNDENGKTQEINITGGQIEQLYELYKQYDRLSKEL
jgi:hypothetical protein